MDTVDQLQKQRRLLVQQMLEITCTRKGTINRQCVRARKNGKPTERLLGPYWVLTAKKGLDRQFTLGLGTGRCTRI